MNAIDSFYINLDSRKDRAQDLSEQFMRLGWAVPIRFGAHKELDGALGAAKSHRDVLRKHLDSGSPNLLMVCEDDVEFISTKSEIEMVIEDFASNPNIDVLCLAYLLRTPNSKEPGLTIPVSSSLELSNEIMTLACYLLKPRAVKQVHRSFEKSVMLLRLGVPRHYAAADVFWQRLQQGRYFFAIPARKIARQASGYSDIYGIYKEEEA